MNEPLPDSIRYLNFGTFRKSGVMVQTPVWFAGGGGTYYAFSAGDAGKVKRLRNSDRARIAPCTVSGKLTGAWRDASAHIVSDNGLEVATAYSALRGKYGWQMRLLDLFARLGGRYRRRAIIRIDLLK